jgi:hypothetical protein
MEPNVYDLSKSFVNKENSCVHVPVQTFGPRSNWVDIPLVIELSILLENHYKDLMFTGKYAVPQEKKIKEYIFYFKQNKTDLK